MYIVLEVILHHSLLFFHCLLNRELPFSKVANVNVVSQLRLYFKIKATVNDNVLVLTGQDCFMKFCSDK